MARSEFVYFPGENNPEDSKKTWPSQLNKERSFWDVNQEIISVCFVHEVLAALSVMIDSFVTQNGRIIAP